MSKKSKTKSDKSLGRALIKSRFGKSQHRKIDFHSSLHTTEIQDGYDWGHLNLNSITEESSFNDFLRTAQLAGTEFQAEKLNIKYINPKQNIGLLTADEKELMERKHKDNKKLLKIPRRPQWTREMSAEELHKIENESFIDWRRILSQLQDDEDILITPYEKNVELWRQLWRVVERSDVIVQIVDARNPLLFRNEDLEKYVHEINPKKVNMILINKSDLLNETQRKQWASYFDKEKIKTAFFSAKAATELPKNDNNFSLEDIKQAANAIKQSLNNLEEKLRKIEVKLPNLTYISESPNDIKNNYELLTREGLIHFFKNLYTGHTYMPEVVTIGLVGYPNVGKSSTINALMTEKKVSVSATPGKTKHFQTLYLEKDLMLCDCPGLVMPSFVFTKADMILNGILPIDQMRNYVSPINLLCNRIPRYILEEKYGIIIAKPQENEDPNRCPYSDELLLSYAYNRGFMTARGQPDQSRAARYILKDYVNGHLLYCTAPPNVQQDIYHTFPKKKNKDVDENFIPEQQMRALRINKVTTSKELDEQFFQYEGSAHIKGRKNFPHIRITNDDKLFTNGFQQKAWRTNKKEKREKLRRKFRHLDEH